MHLIIVFFLDQPEDSAGIFHRRNGEAGGAASLPSLASHTPVVVVHSANATVKKIGKPEGQCPNGAFGHKNNI